MANNNIKLTITEIEEIKVKIVAGLKGAKGDKGDAGEPGASAWGIIGGNINDQTDLKSALDNPVTAGTGISVLGKIVTNSDTGSSAVTNHETTYNHANFNTAYGWGNHALAGYLTSFTETDPVFSSWISATPPLYPGGWYDAVQNTILLSGFNDDLSYENPLTFGTGLSRVGDTVNCDVTQYSDSDAVSAIKADADWKASEWNAKLDDITGESIGDLSDVDITTVAPTDGQVLAFENATGIFKPVDQSGGGGGGGVYGVNVETLTGDKTLTPGVDPIYQILNCGITNRTVTLRKTEATAGDRFVLILLSGSSRWIDIRIEPSTFYDRGNGGVIKSYFYNGSDWIHENIGTYTGAISCDIALGRLSLSAASGVAIGSASISTGGQSIAIGSDSKGTGENASAVGTYSTADATGACALGSRCSTNSKNLAVAKGYYSKAERTAEEVRSLNSSSTNKHNIGAVGWFKPSTTNATPTEIFLADAANQRLTVIAKSVISFRINATARNNVDNVCKAWEITGAIKRDASNNTALVGGAVTKTVIAQDGVYDATYDTNNWDCVVTADDTNEALVITVTGEAGKTISWIAEAQFVEVRF